MNYLRKRGDTARLIELADGCSETMVGKKLKALLLETATTERAQHGDILSDPSAFRGRGLFVVDLSSGAMRVTNLFDSSDCENGHVASTFTVNIEDPLTFYEPLFDECVLECVEYIDEQGRTVEYHGC
jgi:hypothetical protein